MKKCYLVLALIFIAFTLLTGCQNSNLNSSKEMKIDKVLQYKDSYIGDASAVANILLNSPGGPFFKKLSLQTTNPPYGIEVDYGLKDRSTFKEKDFNQYWLDQSTNKLVLNNATTLFILIKNVETVTINLELPEEKSFVFTRKDLEGLYGRDLREYAKDTSLWRKEVLEDTLSSEKKINDYFITHQ